MHTHRRSHHDRLALRGAQVLKKQHSRAAAGPLPASPAPAQQRAMPAARCAAAPLPAELACAPPAVSAEGAAPQLGIQTQVPACAGRYAQRSGLCPSTRICAVPSNSSPTRPATALPHPPPAPLPAALAPALLPAAPGAPPRPPPRPARGLAPAPRGPLLPFQSPACG